MKNREKTILIYGITGLQLLHLTALAREQGIVCRGIPDTQVDLKISQLLEGGPLPEHPPRKIPGRFALMDGFQGQEHQAAALINQAAPGVIKAAHTPHNHSWAFSSLCAHILDEHQAMTR